MPDKYIGLDLGTSSICGVLFDRLTSSNRSETKVNDAEIASKHDWEKLQDPNRIEAIAQSILADLLQDCPDPNGIGVTGQMHGILYYDAEGTAVSPLYTWQDKRGDRTFQNGLTYSEFLSEKSGYFIPAGYGLTTHFYNCRNDLVPDSAIGFCTVMDYLVMKLTGRTRAVIEPSNAASLGCFDLEKKQFDRSALEQAGLDLSFLPEITEADKPVGPLRTELFTKLSGLKNPEKEIPVFPAIGDNQAAFAGATGPAIHDQTGTLSQTVHLTIGTSSQMAVWSDHFVTVPTLETRPFPGGGFLITGAALSGGSSFALLKNFFQKTVRLFNPNINLNEIDFYRIMTALKPEDRTRDPLTVKTLFAGTRTDPQKRGSIQNISLNNFLPEELVFAFLEGIVAELYEFYLKLPEDLRRDRRILACSGNAPRKNTTLRQLLEQTFKLPLLVSDCEEEAATGCCFPAIPIPS